MAYDVITPTYLGGGELPTLPSLTTYRTTPAASVDLLTSISIANNNTTTVNVDLYLVPDGGSPDETNMLLPSIPINVNTVFQWRGLQILEAGTTIQAGTTDSDITIRISGGNAV